MQYYLHRNIYFCTEVMEVRVGVCKTQVLLLLQLVASTDRRVALSSYLKLSFCKPQVPLFQEMKEKVITNHIPFSLRFRVDKTLTVIVPFIKPRVQIGQK